MTLDMRALNVHRMAMKTPERRPALLQLAAALRRGAMKLRRRAENGAAAARSTI